MNDAPPINGMVQSALTILLVFLITPLATGGAIALAVEFGDEKLNQQTPEDKNGFSLYNSECPTLNNPNFLTTTSSNPTATQSSTSITAPSTSYTQQSFTRLQYTVNYNYDLTCQNKKPDTIIFPNNLFQYDEPHTSFNFELFTGANLNSGYWQEHTVDMDFKINNKTFVFLDDVKVGGQQSPTKYSSRISHTFSLTEYNDLVNEQNECETTCEFKVVFSDLTSTQCIGSYCPNGFMSTNQYIKIETFTSDEISSDLVLTVAPYVLGGIYMIIALASTPLWNPIFSETKRRFSNV